ncbi:hypothetical protein ACWOEK_13870 [Enterococcus canis]
MNGTDTRKGASEKRKGLRDTVLTSEKENLNGMVLTFALCNKAFFRTAVAVGVRKKQLFSFDFYQQKSLVSATIQGFLWYNNRVESLWRWQSLIKGECLCFSLFAFSLERNSFDCF